MKRSRIYTIRTGLDVLLNDIESEWNRSEPGSQAADGLREIRDICLDLCAASGSAYNHDNHDLKARLDNRLGKGEW